MNTETVIISHLLFNEKYARKVLPFVKQEYFSAKPNQLVYDLLSSFVGKYNTFPTKEILLIDLQNKTNIEEKQFQEIKDYIIDLKPEKETKLEWLLDKTEQFCKDRSLHNAVLKCIKILDDPTAARGSMEKIMSEALSVSFDNAIGHDFIEDAEQRYDFYHTKEKRIPFDLELFNTITDGGLPNKTLNLIMAVTGGGKSRFKCHLAANNLRNNLNVLYITLEMAEERIAERIDANLLDIPLNELRSLDKEIYEKKIKKLKEKTKGKLIIKEYPTAGAGASHFRFLFNELKLKKNFIPDIVYIDYINICMSSRLKMGANVNSYGYIKAIAEELRGLAVEFNIPIVTSTQINRGGFNNSDIEMEHTSESIGLPATVDLMFALISNEELDNLNQILVKQLKNRYSDPTLNRRFCIGVDKPKMRLYDLENSKENLIQNIPVMDTTNFGKREFNISKFDGFK